MIDFAEVVVDKGRLDSAGIGERLMGDGLSFIAKTMLWLRFGKRHFAGFLGALRRRPEHDWVQSEVHFVAAILGDKNVETVG